MGGQVRKVVHMTKKWQALQCVGGVLLYGCFCACMLIVQSGLLLHIVPVAAGRVGCTVAKVAAEEPKVATVKLARCTPSVAHFWL